MGAVNASCFEPKTPVELFRGGVAECLREGGAAWVTAFAILLAPTLLAVAGQYLIWQSGAGGFMETMRKGPMNPQTTDTGELLGAIAIMVGVGAVTGILSVLANYAGGVAVARMMAERALGRVYRPAQAWDFVLGRAGKIAGGAFALLLVLIGAAVVGEIPGGIIGAIVAMGSGALKPGASPPLITQLAPVATMIPVLAAVAVYLVSMMAATGIENLGGFAALSRSWRLPAGQFVHVLSAIVLAGLAFVLPSTVLGLLAQTSVAAHLRASLGAANGMLVLTAPGAVLSLALSPFMLAVQAAIYFDLRSRQREEGFTPYALAVDLGGELPEGVTEPPPTADASPDIS